MKFIGEYLKKSRLSKKIDLKSVAENLNIPLDLVRNIENNDFSEHLNTVYLVGHIRAYAKFLGLNDNEVVKQFKAQNTIAKRDLFDELPKPIEASNFNFFFTTKIFSFFSIILISFGFYFLFIKTNDMQPNHSILPDLPENLEYKIEETEIQSTYKSVNNIDSRNSINEVSSLKSIDKVINGNIVINQGSVNASTPKEELIEPNNIITLKFLEPTWIQLRNKKDQIVLSKLMANNDEYSYSTIDNFTLTTGNAGNILILINGDIRGKIGKKGEVIDSLVINSDFNN